jgi:hypothetical protein
MSINSLTNDDLKRTIVSRARATRPREVGVAGADPPPESADETMSAAKQADENSVTNALNVLTKYFPAELVSLYIAAVSAVTSLTALLAYINPTSLFWFFIILTPVLYILTYIGKLKQAEQELPGLLDWPWLKVIAATVGFGVWALAIPGNPYVTEGGTAGVGFLALLVSVIFNAVDAALTKST